MDKPLTKAGLAWMLTRLIGCWFVWLAFKGANAFAYAVYLLNSSTWSSIRAGGGARISWDVAWPQALGFFVYGALAYYFLRKGQRFVALICCELVAEPARAAVGGDDFDAWLAEDESRRYWPKAEQHREFAARRQERG